MKPTWLEIYHRDGAWKVANGRTGRILRSEDTKEMAQRKARSMLGGGGKYAYIGFQSYYQDGSRDRRFVDKDVTENWIMQKSTGSRA